MAKKHSRAHLSPMGKVIYNFKQFASNQSEKRYLKFKNNILFGIGGVSPWVRGSNWNDGSVGRVLDSLVEKIYNYHEVSPKEQDTLTFLYKRGRCSIINYEEVGELLQKKAVNAGLRYECANLEKINIKQQLEILSRTKIFVSAGS